MKKLFTLILGLGMVAGANAQSPYAYDLSYDASSYNVQFKSTGDAPSANLILTKVSDGTQTTHSLGAVVKGNNSFYLGAIDINDLEKTTYNWSIQVNGNAITEASQVFLSEVTTKTDSKSRIVRGGVAFVRDTESDAFGKTVVSVGLSQGLSIYSPIFEKEGTYHTDKFSTANRSSSFRICENEGLIYIQDWADNTSGIWTFDPISKTLGNFFDGTRVSGGAFQNADGEIIGGGGTCVDFYGEGNNRFMLSYQEDYPKGNAGAANGGEIICKYNVGEATTWNKKPDQTFPNASAKVNLNTNVEIIALENGMFVSQVRTIGQTNTSVPAFIYVDYNDNILFNAGTSMSEGTGDGSLTGSGSGMAINEDGTLFAFSEATVGIAIFKLTWNNNVPAFEKLYTLPNSSSAEVNQLDFDIAGNLHAFIGGSGYAVYELPNDAPTATTPAKKASLITIDSTVSVGEINTDANAPVEFYNLQGVKVENPANGIFIRKQGSKTTKVVL